MYLENLLRNVQPNGRNLHRPSSSSRAYQLAFTKWVHPIKSGQLAIGALDKYDWPMED